MKQLLGGLFDEHLDGILVTSSTDALKSALDGVEIQLRAKNEPGVTTNVVIGYDLAGARKAVDDFVKSYNALLDAVKSVSSYDAAANLFKTDWQDIAFLAESCRLHRVHNKRGKVMICTLSLFDYFESSETRPLDPNFPVSRRS